MDFVARLNKMIRKEANAGNLEAVRILTSLRNEWVGLQNTALRNEWADLQKRYGCEF